MRQNTWQAEHGILNAVACGLSTDDFAIGDDVIWLREEKRGWGGIQRVGAKVVGNSSLFRVKIEYRVKPYRGEWQTKTTSVYVDKLISLKRQWAGEFSLLMCLG